MTALPVRAAVRFSVTRISEVAVIRLFVTTALPVLIVAEPTTSLLSLPKISFLLICPVAASTCEVEAVTSAFAAMVP